MKKLLFLLAFVALMFSVSAQKFVYGDLHVSKNAIIKGNISAAYISNDSLSVDGQFITYSAGDSIPDLTWVRTYSNTNNYYTGALTDDVPTSAEIIAIVGAAATNGAGFKATIKDSDGTLLIYDIFGDGTDYYYIVSTKSL